MGLLEIAAEFAISVLKPGGSFVAKAFQGGETAPTMKILKQNFTDVKNIKPKASRTDSAEVYLVATGFKGTDTHGLKAFRRDALVPVVQKCVVDRDLFASEFVIRAGREGKKVVEIPLRVAEKRKPSINLIRRVPNVLKNMARLTWVIRVRYR